jgi:hypothetical protein
MFVAVPRATWDPHHRRTRMSTTRLALSLVPLSNGFVYTLLYGQKFGRTSK